MKVDTNEIEWLLKNASGYKISKMSEIPQSTISALVTKKRKIENLTIETGHKLTELAKKLR